MYVARPANLVLPHEKLTQWRRVVPEAPNGDAVWALQVDGRVRGFAEKEASLRRQSFYTPNRPPTGEVLVLP